MNRSRDPQNHRDPSASDNASRYLRLSIIMLVVVMGVGFYAIRPLLFPQGSGATNETPGTAGPSGSPALSHGTIASDLIKSQPVMMEHDGLEGRRLAIQHCQRCHLFVEPEVLPRDIWSRVVLPRMGAFLGMHHVGVDTLIEHGSYPDEKQYIDAAGVYMTSAAMSLKEWQVLVAYFLDRAPDSLDQPNSLAVIQPETPLFLEAGFGYKQPVPTTTLVQIDEGRNRLFVGDMVTTDLSVVAFTQGTPPPNASASAPSGSAPDLIRTQRIEMGSPPVHVERIADQLWVTKIGILNPTDLTNGQLVVLREFGGKYMTNAQKKLTGLRRPVYASFADMNLDGLTDVIVSEYGHQLGSLSYYQANSEGTYDKTELMKEPGSMATHVHDFNQDGWLDVAVINGQGREGLHIFYNNRDGSFIQSYALPLPPHYGSASVAFYDFNSDGALDVLVANGDNGDHTAILKPFHGVCIYLNDKKNGFEESYFFPMNGAYKALAEDFDLDGDLDIAAISMFPDFSGRPEEGFVYLENDGELNFKASTIPSVKNGRWFCMDTGDLDGDGDKDIVIGSFSRGPSAVPPSLINAWDQKAVPGLVLWNQTK